jgi:Zn-dependent protease
MFRSWKLGTFFGIGVYLHWTFLLLLGFAFVSDLSAGEAGKAIFESALIVAVFGCVVLHEFGHALAARAYGIPTRDITLYPIGGVARLERLSERPIEELWIALAGPGVNVVIVALLWPLLSVTGWPIHNWPGISAGGEGRFLWSLLLCNLTLVAFNLLPAFPSDGGRVLRAVLAMRLGRLRATRIAAGIGAGMAFLFLVAGLFPEALGIRPMPMLMLIAVFLYFAGRQELAAVERNEYARRARPLDMDSVWTSIFDVRAPGPNGQYSGFTWDSRSRVWVQWQNGRPVHTVTVE